MVLPLLGIATALAAEFAPTLIRKLAGDDAATVAEEVIGVATAVTGVGDPQGALEHLRANPDSVLQFKQRAAELEVQLETAYLADRQDARARDIAIRKNGGENHRANIMLAMAFICLCGIIYVIWQARLDMPDHVFAMLNMTAGALLKMISDAFQFEFGSSRGSKEKDNLVVR